MRARQIAGAVVALPAALLVTAVPAGAEVTTSPLPDASLFCGDENTQVSFGWPAVGAGSIWISSSGGDAQKWSILEYTHFVADGLVHEPVPVDGLPQVPGKSFGNKTGQQVLLECVLLSRWDLPGDEDDFTVLAPMSLVRPR